MNVHPGGEVPRDDEGPVTWLHDVRQDGVLTYRMGRRGRSLVAEWPPFVRLTCNDDGTDVRVTQREGGSARAMAKLGGVLKALVGDVRGGLGLHASAVALGSRAVVLLGPSGAGKSTAAAQLCLHHGGQLLADDAALLEEHGGIIQVMPSEDHHYLTPESSEALGVGVADADLHAGAKAALRPPRTGVAGYPLALLVLLRFDDSTEGVRRRPLHGAEAAFAVLGGLFRFDVVNRRGELDRVVRLYEQAPFVELARPRRLPDVTACILQSLGGADDS